MPEKSSYHRPSEQIVEMIAQGYNIGDDERQRIFDHAPTWVQNPAEIGLSDQDTAILLYGIGYSSFDGPIALAGEQWNEDGSVSVYIVDQSGRIRWMDIDREHAPVVWSSSYGFRDRLKIEDIGDYSRNETA